MKRTVRKILCLLFVALFVASCDDNDQREWTTYVSDDHAFSLNIPITYKAATRTEQTAFAALPCFYIYWRTSNLSIASMDVKLMEAGYMDVSKVSGGLTKDELLDAVISFFTAKQYGINEYGRIIKYEKIRIDSFPGRSLIACEDVNKADSLMVFMKAYLVGNRVYTLKANGYKTVINTAAIDSFMSSFKLGK